MVLRTIIFRIISLHQFCFTLFRNEMEVLVSITFQHTKDLEVRIGLMTNAQYTCSDQYFFNSFLYIQKEHRAYDFLHSVSMKTLIWNYTKVFYLYRKYFAYFGNFNIIFNKIYKIIYHLVQAYSAFIRHTIKY